MPLEPSYDKFAKETKSAIFWDFAKGGPRENAQKSRPTLRASKTPWRKSHHRLINMHLKCNHRGTFCCKLRLHKCPSYDKCQGDLNRRFSEILPRGHQGKMLKEVGRLYGLQKFANLAQIGHFLRFCQLIWGPKCKMRNILLQTAPP